MNPLPPLLLQGPVLVTGAGGFIGSHLAEELVRRGATVRALVHYNSRGSHGWLDGCSPELKPRLEVILGDVRDFHCVRREVEGCAAVFHLAALIGIPYSYDAPESYVHTNIEGTMNVLEAVRLCGVRRLIHTSTSEVYGSALRVPMDESHPRQAQSPYSATKIGADSLAESYFMSFGTPAIIARPFNAFGPRQSARAIIPTIISQILAGQPEIRVGSLHPTRDLNFVSNTVDGLIALAGARADAHGQSFNIGSGREISIGDLAASLIDLTGSKARILCDEERLRPEKSEVVRLVADSSKLQMATGWQPRVGLEEGLRRTIEWMRENQDYYRAGEYQK